MLPDTPIRSLVLPALVALPLLVLASPGRSQIVPDSTLPVNSAVTTDGTTFTIDGGTAAGTNLFHSFDRFDLPTGTRALFNNTPTVENILTRVTGASASNIDGTLAANSTANLFFINPNGITFGPNASLDIGGSFVASSADAIEFADGGFFSTIETTVDPLLAISVPVGLQFGSAPGTLVNRSVVTSPTGIPSEPEPGAIVGLQVEPGNTLALVGGDVTLEGGYLTAPAGRIELGSTGPGSRVGLAAVSEGFDLTYDTVSNFGNVQMAGGSIIDVSGEPSGTVEVSAGQFQMLPVSKIVGINFGSRRGGAIRLQGSEAVELIGSGDLGTDVSAIIFATDLDRRANSPANGVYSIASAEGQGGEIAIDAPRFVVGDSAFIYAANLSSGRGGDITIDADDSADVFDTQILVDQQAPDTNGGDSGDLTLNTAQLRLDEATIAANVNGEGQGGVLSVSASESIEMIGRRLVILRDPADGSFFGASVTSLNASVTSGGGSAGELRVSTQRLTLRDGAAFFANSAGEGQPGNAIINATESVELIGTTTDRFEFPSSIQVGTFRNLPVLRDGGNVIINTGSLILQDGGLVSAGTVSPGLGGSIEVNADRIELDNEAAIEVQTTFGAGGNIILRTNTLQLDNESQITATAGSAVNFSVELPPEQIPVFAALAADLPQNGGNIVIETDTLVALDNSDITADAAAGAGGRVSITADGIFGTEFRAMETEFSDITATSDLGAEFSGVVEVQTPDVDPNEGLVELQTEPIDPAAQIAIGCNTASDNTFVISQRGGLPEDPSLGLRGRAVWWDGRDLSRLGSRTPTSEEMVTTPVSTLTEARQWTISPSGEVKLMAGSPYSPNGPQCGELSAASDRDR